MPAKDSVYVGAWFSSEEWRAFKEVCERLVEQKILPEKPSKYIMLRYAVLYFTKKMRPVLGLEEPKRREAFTCG